MVDRRHVKKAIVSFSYNDKHKGKPNTLKWAMKAVPKKARMEMRHGFQGVSHVMYRLTDYSFRNQDIDVLKFNLLVGGVPSMVYTYLNVLNSGIEEAAFVGGMDSKVIFDSCQELFNPRNKRKHMVFASEGASLSLFNSVDNGSKALELKDSDKFVFIPGDLPHFYNLDDVISDPDIQSHDLVIDMNCKESMFNGDPVEYPKRNYHYVIDFGKRSLDHALTNGNAHKVVQCKEPNTYIMNGNVRVLLERFYNARKDGGVWQALFDIIREGSEEYKSNAAGPLFDYFTHSNKLPGPSRAALDYILKDNTLFCIDQAVVRPFTKKVNSVIERMKLPTFSNGGNDTLYGMGFLSYWALPFMNLPIRAKGAEGVASDLLRLDMRIKATHTDNQRVNDIDAIEDYAAIQGLVEFNEKHYGDQRMIYPWHEQIEEFRECAMPKLEDKVAMYKVGFNDFMDNMAVLLGMKQRVFGDDGRIACSDYAPGEYDAITLKEHDNINSFISR